MFTIGFSATLPIRQSYPVVLIKVKGHAPSQSKQTKIHIIFSCFKQLFHILVRKASDLSRMFRSVPITSFICKIKLFNFRFKTIQQLRVELL